MKNPYKHLIFLIGITFCASNFSMGQDGAVLFQQNCTACHMLGQRLVGPDLLGVHERRDEAWLIEFIKSSQTVVNSGDEYAVALFEKYNKIPMPDPPINESEIRAIIAYIISESPTSGTEQAVAGGGEDQEIAPIVYTEEDIHVGSDYFSGKKRLVSGGPSCITCHNVTNDQLIAGGLLAKDLTNVYARMGDAGLAGILGAPPFPAMATSYKDNALDSTEIARLIAFLKHADGVSNNQKINSGSNIFILGGSGGLIVLLLLIGLTWNKRLKASVKHDIYKRQIKGSDSII